MSAATRIVIFLTGFSFLLYEVSWHRLLSLVLGATVGAATLVLAAFMGGFGIGARVLGRRADAHPRPDRLLGRLLVGVGLAGALDYVLFTRALPPLYGALSAAGLGERAVEAAVFVVAALLLAAPAFLMGGVFPLVGRIAVGTGAPVAATLGRLYALETLGSTVGGLLTGFVLLGALGQRATTGLAVVLDLGLGAWVLASGVLALGGERAGSAPASARRAAQTPSASARRAARLGAFACGACILGLQVLWLRMFRVYLTNTSYTFALISSLAILGLFVGSTLFARRGEATVGGLVRALLALGLTTLLGLVLLARLPQTLMFPFQSLLVDPMARILLLPLVAGLLVVVPPAIASGYAFPLCCGLYAGRDTLAGDVGRVLLANTAGSVAGPLLAAFVLLPTLGAVLSTLLMATLAGVAAWLILGRRPQSHPAARPVLAITLLVLLAVLVLRPTIHILPPSFERFDRDVLFYRESVEATLSVGRDHDTRSDTKYTFVNNSAVIGSSYDAIKVVKMVGHFPFLAGLDGGDVLVIGFGIGVTTSAIAQHPEVNSITCVELATGLTDAAVYYRDLNRDVVHDPRLEIRSGDGRHYLQLSDERYDLISCDPTHPILGSGNLYTREYFELCRAHLRPGGMISQYLPLHKLGPDEFLGLVSTFRSVFPDCAVWLGHYHAVLLGSTAPLEIDFAEWAARAAALGSDPHFYTDPYHLAATLVLDAAAIDALMPEPRLNTDDRSYTEFFAPACLDPGNIALNLRLLADHRCDLSRLFRNVDDPERLARFAAGNRLLTESLIHRFEGDTGGGLAALREACRVNPEDQEYPFLIRLDY